MKYILISFSMLSVLCSACNQPGKAVATKQPIPITESSVKPDLIYSYEQYQELFDKSSTGLIFSDADLIDTTKDINLVAIDTADSFNTRSFLTLNGDQSDETTQKQLIYKDTNGDALTIVDMIYLKKSMSQDMISWSSKALESYKKEPILDQYDTCSIAYDNILVQITRISKNEPLQLDQMKSKISAVTRYLKKELN